MKDTRNADGWNVDTGSVARPSPMKLERDYSWIPFLALMALFFLLGCLLAKHLL